MGKALRDGYRKKAFLMTKIDGRPREAAARQIDESLRRLGVDLEEKASSLGKCEPFKTTDMYDSTAKHPEWLG